MPSPKIIDATVKITTAVSHITSRKPHYTFVELPPAILLLPLRTDHSFVFYHSRTIESFHKTALTVNNQALFATQYALHRTKYTTRIRT